MTGALTGTVKDAQGGYSHSRQVNAVEVSANPDGLAFGKPRTLFEVPVTAWLRNAMAVSPDGQRFLISVDESDRSTPKGGAELAPVPLSAGRPISIEARAYAHL